MAIKPPHPIVTKLASALGAKAPAGSTTITSGSPEALAYDPNVAELVIFAGYVGPVITAPSSTNNWQVFYLDPRLFRWMLVEEKGLQNHVRVQDPRSPTADCDYIWVKTEARVASGNSMQSVEAPFLTGDFVRAGDFEAPVGGGAGGGATGFFCDARTPTCCRRRSYS